MSSARCRIFALLAVVIAVGAETCDWPPAFWCDDEVVAKRCNVYESCQKWNESSAGRKVKLTVLYEALCPDCQRFVVDVLYPKVFKFAADFVDFELVPYGNARRTRYANGTTKVDCQHGPRECLLNALHACVINVTSNDPSAWMPFVYCMELAVASKVDPEKAAVACYEAAKIGQRARADVELCRNGPLGREIENRAADATEGAWPAKHTSVPWILINGLSTVNMQIYRNDLLPALCAWYVGPVKPSGCEFAESLKRLTACDKNDNF